MEAFLAHSGDLVNREKPVVLCGDYNIIPTEIDVYKPENWTADALFREESRGVFRALQQQGWTDALREKHSGEVIYTYWDYFRRAYERNAGLRIDHFLLNPVLKNRIAMAGVDKHVRGWEKSSDHAPVWVEIA